MGTLKGCLASILLALNVLVCCASLIPFALLKLCVPTAAVRRLADTALNGIAETWISGNSAWMALVNPGPWRIDGVGGLNPRGWYLVSSNHQTWVDILVLQRVFNRRIPLLKFFLKRELIYVPVMGLAWWALDFPFMRRSGDAKSFQKDIAAARRSCERFSHIPTSVISFLEGTRFTPAKHVEQKSPYRHLLKPKTGGLAIALTTLGEKFHSMIDVTIVYPGRPPTFWDLLCGRVDGVQVDVKLREIPTEFVQGNSTANPALRGRLQKWVEATWREKDALIEERRA